MVIAISTEELSRDIAICLQMVAALASRQCRFSVLDVLPLVGFINASFCSKVVVSNATIKRDCFASGRRFLSQALDSLWM